MAGYWPTAGSDPEATDTERDFGRIWLETPKIVFSTTLTSVDFNSRLVRGDVGEQLARLRTEFTGDLEVAGPNLASQFVRRGLVDEYRLMVNPVIIGAGTPFFPQLDAPIDKIVATWPANFAPALGLSLGMRADTDFASIIRAYIADDMPRA